MNLSQLIDALDHLRRKHGDLPVVDTSDREIIAVEFNEEPAEPIGDPAIVIDFA